MTSRIQRTRTKIKIENKFEDMGFRTLDFCRVTDPVHFRPELAPDPDPANQNFKTGSQILLALKESIQPSTIFPYQTYFF